MFRRLATALLSACLISASLKASIAQTRPSDIQWSGKAGESQVQIPAGETPTIMLFVRAGQRQSDDALAQLSKLLTPGTAQAFIVYSGPDSPALIEQNPVGKLAHPAIADADYSLSGKMNVHAWPTTVMINAKGDTIAHIAGVPQDYALEFSSYLEHLAGKIDRAALDAKLSDRAVVADNPAQAAGRHLQIATRLLDRGRLDQAYEEINSGLKLQPGHPHLQLALVRVLILQGKIEEATKALEAVKPGSVPTAPLALARGRILAANGDLESAIEALQQASKLNPNPAEAQYELGLIYQKQEQWEKSAAAFRAAYEARQ